MAVRTACLIAQTMKRQAWGAMEALFLPQVSQAHLCSGRPEWGSGGGTIKKMWLRPHKVSSSSALQVARKGPPSLEEITRGQ